MKGYIGLDIGGTKILGAFFSKEGEPIRKIKKKTKAHEGLESVMDQIYKVIDGLIESDELLGIGAGAPGIIKDDRTVVFSPNIPFRNTDLGKLLGERYNVPFRLGNDVNIATYGEWKRAKETGHDNVLSLFIGTGVGGAIIIDGKLYTGKGGAGEFGHINVQPEGALCGCGSRGCLEAYSSKTGMQSYIMSQLKRGRKSELSYLLDEPEAVMKSSQLEEAYEEGDDLAKEAVEIAMRYLGKGLASLINAFHPDMIIFGGGIMESMGKDLIHLVKNEAKASVMPGMMDGIKLKQSELSDEAGIFGAYELIKDSLGGDYQ